MSAGFAITSAAPSSRRRLRDCAIPATTVSRAPRACGPFGRTSRRASASRGIPSGDGRTSLRTGYGLTGDFVTGQFFFDSRLAPPFGLEQRLQATRLDDPWGALGRTSPFPVEVAGANYPYSQAVYASFISVPYDLKTMRNHSWNVAYQRQIGDNLEVLGHLSGQSARQPVGRGRREPGCLPGGPESDRAVHTTPADGRDPDVQRLLAGPARFCAESSASSIPPSGRTTGLSTT